MKVKTEEAKIAWIALIIFISLLFFVQSGCDDDDDDNDDNDDNNTPGLCSSILEPEGLNLDEFEVTGAEDCTAAGIDIEMATYRYSKWRNKFFGTGTYSSEDGPHYMRSRDKNEKSCFFELEQGEFQFGMSVSGCLNTLTVRFYSVPPLSSSLEHVVCVIRLTATAEGLDECEGSPE